MFPVLLAVCASAPSGARLVLTQDFLDTLRDASLPAGLDFIRHFKIPDFSTDQASFTIKVNDKVVKTYSGAENVPQKPLYAKLHSRSIGYSDMPDAATFSSYVAEFHFEPLATAA